MSNVKQLEQAEVDGFLRNLYLEERSENTVSKYRRDIARFGRFLAEGRALDREAVLAYKRYLVGEGYKASSVNSMLAAVNALLSYLGLPDCRVRLLKIQRQAFRDRSRELQKADYLRLLETARSRKKPRAEALLQTLCGVGIRVSELPFITKEAVLEGRAAIRCKGKCRVVPLPDRLRRILLRYCGERGITSGPVFVTRSGRPMHRSTVWRTVKSLSADAKVQPRKVYPHNLRHLFACTYYRQSRDIAGLAALLGHASTETTRIYTATNETEYAGLINRLGLVP